MSKPENVVLLYIVAKIDPGTFSLGVDGVVEVATKFLQELFKRQETFSQAATIVENALSDFGVSIEFVEGTELLENFGEEHWGGSEVDSIILDDDAGNDDND
ncbi:MAG: hypothetical protein JSW58_08505 [Candidatus Latescibacterota bacterium]|nr:MAG: hypothetical protein JSW58_08505 [Candidatus Latescibacterota bacterium]